MSTDRGPREADSTIVTGAAVSAQRDIATRQVDSRLPVVINPALDEIFTTLKGEFPKKSAQLLYDIAELLFRDRESAGPENAHRSRIALHAIGSDFFTAAIFVGIGSLLELSLRSQYALFPIFYVSTVVPALFREYRAVLMSAILGSIVLWLFFVSLNFVSTFRNSAGLWAVLFGGSGALLGLFVAWWRRAENAKSASRKPPI